jgi:hypothetical protein
MRYPGAQGIVSYRFCGAGMHRYAYCWIAWKVTNVLEQ